jgi:uncharacterized protein (DUF488 family)
MGSDVIFTIGHSTRSAEELIALLREAGVDLLVDVRTVPRSRFNPQFNTDVFPQTLAAAEIGYRHFPALGGLRHRPKGAPPSPNTLWRNEAFQAYADYALTAPFRAALDELRGLARDHVPAIMCAEAVWWQCHRRIVADYLLAAGIDVEHIMGEGKIEPASLTPGAEPHADGTIAYPAAQGELL